MKTLDRQGNITKQAQKKRYPKYIAYINYKVENDVRLFQRAMVETELLDAMRTLEAAANKRAEDVYLVCIYEKQAETTETGEPLYKNVIGARMGHRNINGDTCLGGWHFWDAEHGESPHGLCTWISKDFARDGVKEWSRDGSLHHYRNE